MSIINLSVGIQSAATPRTSFGIPLILDFENFKTSTAGSPSIETYASLAEMLADGWKTYHQAYKLAAAMMAQQPRPAVFKVAGMTPVAGAVTFTTDLNDIVAADTDWWLLMATTRVEANIKEVSVWAEAANTRCLFLACTNDYDVTAAGGGTVMSDIYAAGRMRTALAFQDSNPLGFQITYLSIDKEMTAGDSFTGVVNGVAVGPVAWAVSHNSTMDAIAVAIAATAPAGACAAYQSASAPLGGTLKDYIYCISAVALADLVFTSMVIVGGSNPSLTAAEYRPSYVPFDGAWVGKVLSYDPGSATWAHKTLAGVTADTLTAAQRGYIQAQRGNWYSTELGFKIAYPGTCSKDSSPGTPYFIDQVQLADAIESELQTGLMDILNRSKKIPYTDQGVAMLLAEFKKVEDKYVSTGALVKKSFTDSYTIPTVASQTAGDVSSRIYRGLTANWQTSGGIHICAAFVVNLAA